MRFIFGAMTLFVCAHCVSQNCNHTLSGRVIDLHDDTPLSGATIIVVGSGKSVLSDLDGSYEINDLCEGEYNLQIAHPECKTLTFKIEVPTTTYRDFELEHHIEELNQITVVGKAFTTRSETLLENRISLKTIEGFVGANFGDALNTLSGVSSLNTGNTVVKPMINGLHSSRVTIINNGVRMQDQEWGAEHAPNIDLNTAGNIVVLKGVSALQYSGDAIGGVVISEPLPVPAQDSLFGKTLMALSSNGRGGVITSTLTKTTDSGWYGTLQGTFKRFGDFEAPDYILSNTGTFERDASLRVGKKTFDYGVEGYYSYFRNDIGILRASHLGGAQDQVAAINNTTPLIVNDFTYEINAPRQEVTHHLAQLSGFARFENLGKLSASYNFQLNERFEYDIRRGDDSDTPSVDLELTTHVVNVDLESSLTDKIELKTGLSGTYQNNFADPETGVRRIIPDYDLYRWSVFGIADISVSDRVLLEFGARFDYTDMDVQKFYRTSFWESRGYDVLFADLVVEDFGTQVLTNPQLTFENFSGTAGINYQLGSDYVLYANYSLASRAPNPSELFSEGLHHGASRIELGDLRFDSEVGNKVALTIQKKTGTWTFTLNPYVNFLSKFVILEPTRIEQTIRGNFQVWEYRQTSASLAGVDFDLQGRISESLEFLHQFSYVRGQDRTLDMPLINIPAASTANTLRYSLPNLNGLVLELKSDFVFKQGEFPDNNFEVFIPETETLEVVDVSTPPDAYHLLEFNGQCDFKLNDNGSVFTVGLKIANIFDTSYRNYLNRLRFYAEDLGRNFTLNLKVNY